MRATFSKLSKPVEQISGGAATLASSDFAASHLCSPLDAIGLDSGVLERDSSKRTFGLSSSLVRRFEIFVTDAARFFDLNLNSLGAQWLAMFRFLTSVAVLPR